MALTTLPVYRASLPRSEALLPYLRIIDENRWYSNRGQLVSQLEMRLGERLGAFAATVCTAANGTVALEAAILATAGRATAERPYALLPGYTFVATAAAVEACGYRPYLIDVDPRTWALAASALRDHPLLERTGIVVPVAPYGRALALANWIDFRERTGIPVAIDAAASLEALLAEPETRTGAIPVALSFQATKAYSTGEGGAVVWSDLEGLARVAQALNFGFLYKRQSTSAGTNGKLSEYHAAVGLAALDRWEATAQANAAVANAYRRIAHAHDIGAQVIVAPDVASNYALVAAGERADALMGALANGQIESRRWYGIGIHREPYWIAIERDPLPVTERLGAGLVGLPIATDIAEIDIARVIRIAAEVLAHARS
jgi:dTDP-4-amino-4,6-dideoxygalactose transaminase